MGPDLGTLATALYVTTDDLLIRHPEWAPERPAVGIVPRLSDAELVTLAVIQALLGYTSEARFLRWAKTHLRPWFPYLPTPAALLRAVSGYREAAPVTVGDHVIIGTNPQLGVLAHSCWPSARLVVRGGPDGADTALLEEVENGRWVAARYDRIVVGSGDGVFAVVAKTFRRHGLAVGVVSREQSLSYALGRAATFVRILPDPAPTKEAA